MSNDSYDGSPGLCRQANGIDGAQSLALSPDGRSLYVAGVQSNAVAALSLDSSTGLPTQVAGTAGCTSASATPGCSTGSALGSVDWVTVSPDGSNVYATSFTSGAVDVFSRDPSTGGISQLSLPGGCISSVAGQAGCAPGTGLGGAAAVAVSPDGRSVYVASYNSNALAAFARGSGGALLQLPNGQGCLSHAAIAGCTPTGDLAGASAVAISPDSRFVYVAASGSQAVTVYSRDPTTGALARVPGAAGCVAAFASRSCTQANGLEGPKSIAISPDGSHVYVSSFTRGPGYAGDPVAIFSRDQSTGALTQLPGKEGCISGVGGDPACGSAPGLGGNFALKVSPDGSYVYVTAYANNAVAAFSADSSGALTALPGPAACVSSSAGGCARGVGLNHVHETVLSADGRFAYTVANTSDTIDVFARVAPMAGPPANLKPPTITGSSKAGHLLSLDAGAWSGVQSGYGYQWQSCDSAGGNCSDIRGAQSYTLSGQQASATYRLTAADAGHRIRAVVTAVNSAGPTTVASEPTSAVVGRPDLLRCRHTGAGRHRAHSRGKSAPAKTLTCTIKLAAASFPASKRVGATLTVGKALYAFAIGGTSNRSGRLRLKLKLTRRLRSSVYTLKLWTLKGPKATIYEPVRVKVR